MDAGLGRSLSYREAGVDIDRAARAIEAIRGAAGSTHLPGVLAGIGGFAALMRVPTDRYARPVMVTTCDGVGTKIRVAQAVGRHRGIGVDLVAMVVNDLLPCGATPCLFLDYVAMGRLEDEVLSELLAGMVDGCREAGCALVGGETAEMPGVYAPGEYDVAGFGVGLVEEAEIVDGSRVEAGDRVVGLASTGLHSNGFSLVRRLLAPEALDPAAIDPLLGRSLAAELLEPTRLYVRPVLALRERFELRAMAHITGGGLLDNLPRSLPEHLGVRLERDRWPLPPIFRWLSERGGLGDRELLRTFNCGIGFGVVVPAAQAPAVSEFLARERGVPAFEIGTVRPREELRERVDYA